jgi:hypothetical protein
MGKALFWEKNVWKNYILFVMQNHLGKIYL